MNPGVEGMGSGQVLEVNALGSVRKQEVSRRQLLKSSGELKKHLPLSPNQGHLPGFPCP